MKSQTVVEKIKDILGIEAENLLEKVEFKQVTLDNGQTIESTSFLPGDEVFIVGEDNEKMPLPKGEYTMADGQKLVVEEDGIIKSTTAGGSDVAPKEEVEAKEEIEASKENDSEEKIEAADESMYVTKEEFNKAIDEIKNTIVELAAKDENLKEQELAEQESKEIVKEELSKTEVAEPIAHNPEAKVEEKFAFNYMKKEDSVQQRINKILNNL